MNNITITGEIDFLQYVKKVDSFPLLTEKEEVEYSKEWFYEQATEAAHHLVVSHLRLVPKVALKFRNYGLPLMDLVSEGNVGLMKAVKNFNPEYGYKLATYAIWWVKAAIQEFILKSWSLVKIGTTTAQRKLFFNLRKIKNKLLNKADVNNYELITTISEQLSISTKEVEEMDIVLSQRDLSFNQRADDSSNSPELHEMFEAPGSNQELEYAHKEQLTLQKSLLMEALNTLDERYRYILINRKLRTPPMILETLSRKYKISRERVRQIEQQAVCKIKQFLEKNNYKKLVA